MLRHLLTALALAALAPIAAAQTVDELIAKNLAARGGVERIKAVLTMRVTGMMPMGPSVEAPFVMEFKRPNQMRQDVNYQGMTTTRAFDGKMGWLVMPSTGRREPQVLPQEALKQIEAQADFIDGPLVDYRAKGHKVEYVGKEKVEGTDTYVLEVSLKSGEVSKIFLDAEQYLEIRSEGKTRGPTGGDLEIETLIGDYREVDGLMLPHLHEVGPKGGSQKMKMTVQKYEINVPLDDVRFRVPK